MAIVATIGGTQWTGLVLSACALCVVPSSGSAALDAANPKVAPLSQVSLPAIQMTAQPPGASPEKIHERQLAQIASVAQLTSVSGTPIVVIGEGTVRVAPDLALVRGGVTTRAASVREAADTNSRTMTAIINKLIEAGIDRKDVQTSQFSIQPVYSAQPSYDSSHTTHPLGYNVSNQVVVKIRSIEKVADIVDLMIAAGANNVWDLEFLVSDPSKALDEARRSAIADARHKAELYASAAGVELGPVVSVNEQGTVAPGPIRGMRAAIAGDKAPPIEPGEDTLRVSVSVGFAIGR
jgi:uncharacterized protein